MAKEKKEFKGNNLDLVIKQANDYLETKVGWDTIQLTYGSHKNIHIIAFTASNKSDGKKRQFVKSPIFDISGNKEVGIFYVDDVEYFVGVPN